MRTTLRTLLLTGAAVFARPAMEAQQNATAPFRLLHQEVDLAVTYSAERSNLTTGSNFWRWGGDLELSTVTYHGFGIAMNIAGSRVSDINGTGVNLTAVNTTFGPRYTWSPALKKVAVFGQGLIGESHALDSVFPSATEALTDFNTFALQVGGGVDLRLSHHFAFRPIQANWVRTQFPNGSTNIQNNLRLGAGVVLRLP